MNNGCVGPAEQTTTIHFTFSHFSFRSILYPIFIEYIKTSEGLFWRVINGLSKWSKKKTLEVQDQRAAKQRAQRGINKHGGEAVFKHWATEEKSFRRVTDTKARLGGIKCWKMREEFSGIDSTFKGFREEEKTRDRAIILEIWRVKIKLPDNKQSEMNQFWKYMLMQCGRSEGGGGGGGGGGGEEDKAGCQCFHKWLGIRQQAFGNIGLYSQTVFRCLPHYIYAQIIFEAARGLFLLQAAIFFTLKKLW